MCHTLYICHYVQYTKYNNTIIESKPHDTMGGEGSVRVGILADAMGLGKTVQVLYMYAYISIYLYILFTILR